MSLWERFKEFAKDNHHLAEEDLNGYLRDFDNWEVLDEHIYYLADFVEKEFRSRYGDYGYTLWFLSEPDPEGKHNKIRVTRRFNIGGKEYDVEIDSLELRWGVVADTPEEFNEIVDGFIKTTKEKLDNLFQHLQAE